MTAIASKPVGTALATLTKANPADPAFVATGRDALWVLAGTTITIPGAAPLTFDENTPISLGSALVAGSDYSIVPIVGGTLLALPATGDLDGVLGGFHYAPGGNAAARAGGDDVPAINPYSIWDLNFRPACADPRGMAHVSSLVARSRTGVLVNDFWVDLYLTAADHLERGTSWFGAQIADGGTPPENPTGGRYDRFDYSTAQAVLAHHGKQLLSLPEAWAAFFGVTEKTAAGKDPKKTGLDAARTSKFGLMQATGNLYVWGHDGDPDAPRAAVFGGYWDNGDWAGSRFADVEGWPGDSFEWLGARGRCDHLQHD